MGYGTSLLKPPCSTSSRFAMFLPPMKYLQTIKDFDIIISNWSISLLAKCFRRYEYPLVENNSFLHCPSNSLSNDSVKSYIYFVVLEKTNIYHSKSTVVCNHRICIVFTEKKNFRILNDFKFLVQHKELPDIRFQNKMTHFSIFYLTLGKGSVSNLCTFSMSKGLPDNTL